MKILNFNETYRDVTYPNVKQGMYKISNYGNLYSIKKGKVLNKNKDHLGYVNAKLVSDDDGYIYTKLHRLVAWEFCEGYDYLTGRTIVNHKDSNRSNNEASNLEWCTSKENFEHGATHGNWNLYGDNNPVSVYSEDDVRKWCRMMEKGILIPDIVRSEGYDSIDHGQPLYVLLGQIKNGRRWSHISSEYKISKQLSSITKYPDELIHTVCQMLSDGKKAKHILANIQADISKKKLETLIYNIRKKNSHVNISKLYDI